MTFYIVILINNVLFQYYVFRSKSEFKVALQCDETVEGTVDPVVSDVTANKHVSTDSFNNRILKQDIFFLNITTWFSLLTTEVKICL